MKNTTFDNETLSSVALFDQLNSFTTKITRQIHNMLRNEQLSVTQFEVLRCLFEEGTQCHRDLSARVQKTGGNITTVIDTLEVRRLVERSVPRDRRYIMVMLTPQGKKLMQNLVPRRNEMVNTYFASFTSEELQQLAAVVQKLGETEPE